MDRQGKSQGIRSVGRQRFHLPKGAPTVSDIPPTGLPSFSGSGERVCRAGRPTFLKCSRTGMITLRVSLSGYSTFSHCNRRIQA